VAQQPSSLLAGSGFEFASRAVTLETDCSPSIQFFQFLEEMPDRHESSKEVFVVSGNNFESRNKPDKSYCLSTHANTQSFSNALEVLGRVSSDD